MHACSRCGDEFPIESFPATKKKAGRTYRRWLCRVCRAAVARDFRKKNPESSRNSRLKLHGISLDIYREMERAQGNVCGICRKPSDKVLRVDHDHKCCPGTFGCAKCVRGLLCESCNKGIGLLYEDETTLLNAIDYLRKWR